MIKEKSNIYEKIYILSVILSVFSGSTFLQEWVMPLVCLMIVILFFTSSVKGFPKNAVKNKENYFVIFNMIIICIFLIYQMFSSYDNSITVVFLERFIVFTILCVFLPKVELCFKTIKSMRMYSFLVAISILISTIFTGKRAGGLVGNYQFAGMAMSISFGIFLVDYYFEKNSTNLFGVIISFLALLCTGKRTFTLLALVAYIVIFFFSNDSKKHKKFIIMSSALLFMFLIAYATIPAVRLVFERMQAYLGDSTYNGRTYYWDVAIEIFENNKLTRYWYGRIFKLF